MTLLRTPDVLVIGGGVIGCAIARELAGSRRVLLVDRGPIGGEASSAAAGALGVASGDDAGERLALRRAGLAAFPALVAALRDETAIDVGFAPCGTVRVTRDEVDAAAASTRAAERRADGYRVEVLDAGGVRALEPVTTPNALGGLLFPDDAVVVAQRLVAALAESARRRGATLVPGLPVLAVERAGERLRRVRIGADWIEPGLTILATGAWGASGVAALDVGVDVAPVRGQMMAIRPPRGIGHVMTAGSAFLIPRPHGEVWVGATFEDAGFVKAVTVDGLHALAEHLASLAPALRGATIIRTWAGLRPSVAGGGPVLGRVPGLTNLLVALGHHRNGILLAPITAHAVRACIEGAPVPSAAEPFLVRGS